MFCRLPLIPLRRLFACGAMLACVFSLLSTVSAAEPVPGEVAEFVSSYCLDCHQGDEPEAGFDMEALSFELSDPDVLQRWVRIHDRIRDGEMPPPDYTEVLARDAKEVLEQLSEQITAFEKQQEHRVGRVPVRRLTRKQVEGTLHDLLGIDIPLADQLPEESRAERYTTVAASQTMSHFQLQSHLAVVDVALDEAFRRAFSPPDVYDREFDAQGLSRTNPKRRCREPEMRNGQAVIWNGGVIFYGRLPATRAPKDGWYRFSLTVSAVKPPSDGGVWSTVRTGLCVSSAPLLLPVTCFEATEQPKTITFEAWLPEGHMLEIRPGDATLKRGRFQGGQIGVGEGEPQNIPGIAFDRLTMQQFHRTPDTVLRNYLFGEFAANDEKRELAVGAAGPRLRERLQQLSTSEAKAWAHRLMVRFARRAFRKPVRDATLAPYLHSVEDALDRGEGFEQAIRLGYRSLLCSPRFLYLTEGAGALGPHELATRLSYFLTNSCPDEELTRRADSGELSSPGVLREQADRLLRHDGGSAFLKNFAAEWLDLDKLRASTPSRKLYREFDPVVESSMLDETHAFLRTLLSEDLSVVRLIDADFTFLNSRLARFYDLDEVTGDGLRRVALSSDDRRGGILTHGAILKITANGTNTSPVVRGVWMSERLLGVPIPPPPANVPAVEPDIRGAKTIRDQLAKHRSDEACASCHKKIDPVGFALENFDAAGQWRDVYRTANGKKTKLEIDASYQLADGQRFEDIREFRTLVAADSHRIAANVAENFLVYATGCSLRFSDRAVVDEIATQVAAEDFGFRSILHAVITSPVFLHK